MRCLVRAILVVVILLSVSSPVMAGTVVTVSYTPHLSGGISSFTITYVSDTQIDLDWSLYGNATGIMIRAKYGDYPADIPDENTAPTDGYLVYSGNATSVSDMSMDFDQSAGTLYYSAWAYKADGTWYTTASTGWRESETMLLLGLLFFAIAFTISSAVFKKGWLSFAGAGGWIATAVYCYTKAAAMWDIYYILFWIFMRADYSLLVIPVSLSGNYAGE